jgi:hypothetical protein
MFSPGSKGWINKYFNLVEKNQINLHVELPSQTSNDSFVHAALGYTGIIFGFPSRLHFAKTLDDSTWTTEEKLKLLLFESHLLVYLVSSVNKSFQKDDFIQQLLDFYGNHNASSVAKMVSFFIKETREERIESILTRRVDIKMNLLENRFWVNYLNNVFIYLDVILFHDFLLNKQKNTLYHYDEMAVNALTSITLAASSDGKVQAQEKAMFSLFLASANLSDEQRELSEKRFENGASFNDFTSIVQSNWLLKRFIFDLSTFVIFSNQEAVADKKKYLIELCNYLNFEENDLNEALVITEQFIISNQDKLPFLNSSSSIEKVYSSLSKRWIKVLGRNKDKLVKELKQSKELVSLIRKSTSTELTKQEKEVVKTQFKDMVKSMPSLAIFMLPGGAFLLPLVLKVIPDLLPSAFRDNEVDE